MSAGSLRPRLLMVWSILAVLIGVIAAIEFTARVRSPHEDRSSTDPRLLLPVSVDQLDAIEIGHARMLHRFERDAAGLWLYHRAHADPEAAHAHRAEPAMASRIESALAGFGRTRIERRLPLDGNATEYGVGMPGMFILIYGRREQHPLAQYAVGDVAPDTFSRYVLRVGSSTVLTIPNYQIDNLLALIEAVTAAP